MGTFSAASISSMLQFGSTAFTFVFHSLCYWTQRRQQAYPVLTDRPNDQYSMLVSTTDRPNHLDSMLVSTTDRPNHLDSMLVSTTDRPNDLVCSYVFTTRTDKSLVRTQSNSTYLCTDFQLLHQLVCAQCGVVSTNVSNKSYANFCSGL